MFCSKDRIPSIFFMPDVLIKEKKKQQSFINGLPKLAEDLETNKTEGHLMKEFLYRFPLHTSSIHRELTTD